MKVIAISGRIGAGKSYLAGLLEFRLKDAVVLSFAGPLKELAIQLGWNGKKDAKGRRLLQLLGTDVCRECIDDKYWIKKMITSISICPHQTIIIDDLRFEDELYELRSIFGDDLFHVHLVTKESFISRLIYRLKHRHKSEQGIKSKPDVVYVNKYDYDMKEVVEVCYARTA